MEAAKFVKEVEAINNTFDNKQKEASKAFKECMAEMVDTMVKDAGETVVRDVEKKKTKSTIEDLMIIFVDFRVPSHHF